MGKAHRILVVEDDAAIRRGLVDALTYAGFTAIECSDGACVLDLVAETSPTLVLLDVLLPHRDGFSILEELRRLYPAIAVILVTARGAENDRITGLRGGADDYVVKPFSPKELIARIEAVLRRAPDRTAPLLRISLNGRTVDLSRREVVFANGERGELTEREAGILAYLAANPDRAIDRDELLHRVWGLDPRGIETRTVDMHIARLRERIGDAGSESRFVMTVRSKGYMLGRDVQRIDVAPEAAS